MNIEAIKDTLRNPKNEFVVVRFKKLNNEVRDMKCTLCINRIPEDKIPTGKDVLEEVVGEPKVETACRVFDLDKQEWRSFRYDSILFITEYPMPIITKPNEPEKITRLEIIDEDGRKLVKNNIKLLQYSLQDNGKTLKLFVDSGVYAQGLSELILDNQNVV